MNHLISLSVLAVGLSTALATTGAAAQEPLPRSYVASPDVYKVFATNDEFTVVEATWKPGQKDLAHSHRASAVYFLNDCTLRTTLPDGKSYESNPEGGRAILQPPIPAHVVENAGAAECRMIMFEPSK